MMRLYLILLFATISSSIFGQSNVLSEGFESWPATGWSNYTLAAGTGWVQSWQSADEAAHGGDHSAYPSINNLNCNNWLVSPPVVIENDDYVLRFWERFDNIEHYGNSVVNVSRGSHNPSDGDYQLLFSNSDTSTVWKNRSVDLTAFEGDTVYFAFQYTGTWHLWFVDDVLVGPTRFVDAALSEIVSPIGTSMDPSIETVKVSLVNQGTEVIDTVSIKWSVSGANQMPYEHHSLNLKPLESIEITLGAYSFDTEGYHVISANVITPNDFNPDNDKIEGGYALTSPRDGRLGGIDPESFNPLVGIQDVRIELENRGDNIIDSTEVSWTVNGVPQTKHKAVGLQLSPGESTTIVIGQYDFEKGIHIIDATALVVGDIETSDNVYRSYAAIDTFWESFEGRVFPPHNWSINFGVKDNFNFDNPPHGDYYYSAISDNNYFGVVADTVFTPVLEISAGDSIRFRMKNNPFLLATNEIIARHNTTDEILQLATIQTLDNQWDRVAVDISAAEGFYAIGIVTRSAGSGHTKIDHITSNASVYSPQNDLAVVNAEIYFLARKDVNETYNCVVRNNGPTPISGAEFNINLMDQSLGMLASIPGKNMAAWESTELSIPFQFDNIGRHNLYIEIDYSSDPDTRNNYSRMTKVQVVPESTILKPLGQPDYIDLNFPFNGNGNTQTLGEDDISQTIYYPDEIDDQGNIYGIIYKYDNLLSAEYIQKIPFKVWVSQTAIEDLSGGWLPNEELILVFDDTVRILPGNDNELYIPFDTTVSYTGQSQLVIQDYAYSPEWPPSILRMYATVPNTPGKVRTIWLQDVYDLDPINPPVWFGSSENLAFTTLVMNPIRDTGRISGYVLDINSNPITGAMVTLDGTGINTTTDINGEYSLPFVPWNAYSITASAPFYSGQTQLIQLDTTEFQLDFGLDLRPHVMITGQIAAGHDHTSFLKGVDVDAVGYTEDIATTDESGEFILSNIYGVSEYQLTFSRYGYYDKVISISVVDSDINIGTIYLDQEQLSPFDVNAILENGETEVTWKDPLFGMKGKLQNDLDICSYSYTNEPDENVWLGNLFYIYDTTTITQVEVRTDVYELSDGKLFVDIFDHNEEIIATSNSFKIKNDTTMIVELPNIVVYDDIYAMVHWKDNPESTHALCLDYSEKAIVNTAVIKYPGGPISLFSELFEDPPNMAFNVRLHTLENASDGINEAKAYNIYKGWAEDFPNSNNWQLINPDPVSNLWIIDDSWSAEDESGLYRYSVETVYPSGLSEETFSNEVDWDNTTAVIDLIDFTGRFDLYPVPASDHIRVELDLESEADVEIAIYNGVGQLVDRQYLGQTRNVNRTRMLNDLASGTYIMKIRMDESVISKQFVVIKS